MGTALVEAAHLPALSPEVVEQAIALLFVERIGIVFEDLRPFEIAERHADLVPVASRVTDERLERAEDHVFDRLLGERALPERQLEISEVGERELLDGRIAERG